MSSINKLAGIGLGTFPFAGVFGSIDKNNAAEILSTYFEYGGDFIHTSVAYGNGVVESFLGDELSHYDRSNYKIMSCCGWKTSGNGLIISGKREDVLRCCDESLNRLNLGYIDIFMLHNPDPNTPPYETIEAMKELKKVQKIGAICVSNTSLEQLEKYNYSGAIDYVQNRFSLLNQGLDTKYFDYCLSNNIKIITYQGIERGILTNQAISGIALKGSDLRNKKPEFSHAILNELCQWVKDVLFPIAHEYSISVTALAIKWSLVNQNVFCCLCGISKMKYFADFLEVSQFELSDTVLDNVNRSYNEFNKLLSHRYGKTVKEFMGI